MKHWDEDRRLFSLLKTFFYWLCKAWDWSTIQSVKSVQWFQIQIHFIHPVCQLCTKNIINDLLADYYHYNYNMKLTFIAKRSSHHHIHQIYPFVSPFCDRCWISWGFLVLSLFIWTLVQKKCDCYSSKAYKRSFNPEADHNLLYASRLS